MCGHCKEPIPEEWVRTFISFEPLIQVHMTCVSAYLAIDPGIEQEECTLYVLETGKP